MKTLVTGAPGWLGDTLVQTLVNGAEGYEVPKRDVRCLVMKGADASKLRKLGVETVEGDMRDAASLEKAVDGVETVFHCAGLIHPKRIKELFDINTKGTQDLLAAAARKGVRRVVFVSSNSPAGTNKRRDVPMREDDPPRPYKAYGRSKHLAECAVREYQRSGKLETVIVRPCWFYGPNQPARQSRFFNMIKAGNPLVFGDGKNLRSMSYVDNLVQGLVLAEKTAAANGRTYWIADERPYETLEIYRTIAELLEVKDFMPRHIPGFSCTIAEIADTLIQTTGMYWTEMHVAGEMNKNIACTVEKAKNELGYAPAIELREGMRRSIEWCRANGMDV